MLLFLVLFIAALILRFICSETFQNWSARQNARRQIQELEEDEKKFEAELKQFDEETGSDLFGARQRRKQEEKLRHDQNFAFLKTSPDFLNAYFRYLDLASKRHVKKMLSFEEFIELELQGRNTTGEFTLNLDQDGNIISVFLENFGEVSLEHLRKVDPLTYDQIMREYEKFKRDNNL